ncbi:MAG: 4Fe-4S binding protein [Candidatus Omnitrophica bacterium]|nr:4Fe-4S binding protein [Candidatus Omnitrophota bacterium]
MRFKKLVLIRRFSQIIFLLGFIYILWATTYPLTSSLPSDLFFKTNPLLMIIATLSERIILKGIIYSLILLLLSMLIGRYFCGWICPLGSCMDFANFLNKKKFIAPDKTNIQARKLKYLIFLIIFGFALFKIQVSWLFDPIVIFGRFVSLNLIPAITLIIDQSFISLLKASNLSPQLFDVYRDLQQSILGVKISFFPNSWVAFLDIMLIILTSFYVSRLWCRTICPLGGLYALAAKCSPLQRVVTKCIACGKCNTHCRMGAIKKDFSYLKSECILCMDCIYDCPTQETFFRFKSLRFKHPIKKSEEKNGLSRREFLIIALTSSLSLLAIKKSFSQDSLAIRHPYIIRPPAALKEDEFLNRCIRCGNCMKVCPTNGLQPVIVASGARGVWSPQLIADIGYCEYNCTLCSQVCPTGAIKKLPLEKKQKTKLGIAKINRKICLPWAKNKECIVCEEHCPIPDKAIKIKEEIVDGKLLLRPEIDEKLCIGCGICQTKCPIRPIRAIKMVPEKSDRM